MISDISIDIIYATFRHMPVLYHGVIVGSVLLGYRGVIIITQTINGDY
jgi:hypothetical protein